MTSVNTIIEPLAAVNQLLDSFFAESTQQAKNIDPSYHRLWQSLHELINAGGKRFRPSMTLLAYDVFGGTSPESITPVAAAQELLHLSLLIHDDIIDRDDTRYGVLNISGRYKQFYTPFVTNHAEQAHYANSAAILAGDLLLSGAHQLINESSLTAHQKTQAGRLLSRGIFEVAGGELLDTELSFTPYTTGDALTVARYKTAGYSFIAPLVTGATLAGATNLQIEKVHTLATALGVAYQLVDDLLGVFGDEAVTGKSVSSDLREGKRTFMVEKAHELMDAETVNQFSRHFGNSSASVEQIETLRQLLVTCGAKKATEEAIESYTNQAIAALDDLSLSPDKHQRLSDLISKVTQRAQ